MRFAVRHETMQYSCLVFKFVLGGFEIFWLTQFL